ncbi:MAG TPA: CAP domain-containing protein [Solirubrobacter sp.]
MSATRRLLAAAVATALLTAPAAAQARSAPPKGIKAKATVALGDKRAAKAKTAQACTNVDAMPTPQNIESIRAALLCLHNQFRAQNRLPALKDNAKLRKAATGYANDMVDQGFFDHTSPDGETFVDRVIGAGYAKRNEGWSLGENLAWGTGEESTPRYVMDAWMNSAGHKANILKASYQEIGIGIRLGVPSDPSVGVTFTIEFGVKA